MTIEQKTLSLNVFLLTLNVLLVGAVKSPLPLFNNLHKFTKTIISFIINMNISSLFMLLDLSIFGGFTIYLTILEKYSLGGLFFTLFIRFFLVSDDG